MTEKIDPEMLKNLDLLLAMDEVESEADWEDIEKMDEKPDDSENPQDSEESYTTEAAE